MLAADSWATLKSLFAPHSVDLVALDVNAQRDSSGAPQSTSPRSPPPLHMVFILSGDNRT